MTRPRSAIPTPAEMRALLFLHKNGPSTVREYLEKGEFPHSHAYTSVMSLLTVMFEKGLVTRTQEGRAFRYTAAMSQNDLRLTTLSYVLDHVFGGNIADLKAALVELEKRPPKKKK
jgi:BlaI family penicillinase repressor